MSLSTYLKDAGKCALTAVHTFGVFFTGIMLLFPPLTRLVDNPNGTVVALKRTIFAELNTFKYKKTKTKTVLGGRVVEINVAAVRVFTFQAATGCERRLALAPLSGSES